MKVGKLTQSSPESNKLGKILVSPHLFEKVWRKRSGVNPIVESKIWLRTDSTVDADGKYHKSDNGNDLDTREPELNLAVELDRKQIDASEDDPEDTNEDSDVDGVFPVLDDNAGCGKFERVGDCPGKPVDVAH
jgi:hypothetical protein